MSSFLANASDLVVLLTLALVSVGTALGIAALAHRFFFAPRTDEIDPHAKLLDLVHASLLAFIAFMLAISLFMCWSSPRLARRSASVPSRMTR